MKSRDLFFVGYFKEYRMNFYVMTTSWTVAQCSYIMFAEEKMMIFGKLIDIIVDMNNKKRSQFHILQYS